MIAIKDMEMPRGCGECNLTACKGYDEPWNYCCAITLTDIDLNDTEKPSDCPLVEIEERKHGEWEHDKLFGECAYVCSFCHTIWTSSEIQNMHYCPTCGAEMRGNENE